MPNVLVIALGIVLAVVALGMAPVLVAVVVNWRSVVCSLLGHKWERVKEYTAGGMLTYKVRHRCSRCGAAPGLLESGELRRIPPGA